MEDAKFTEKSYSVIGESITNTAKTKNECTFPPQCTNLSMWEEGYSNHPVCVLPLYLRDYKTFAIQMSYQWTGWDVKVQIFKDFVVKNISLRCGSFNGFIFLNSS